jgi:hypothetical protein
MSPGAQSMYRGATGGSSLLTTPEINEVRHLAKEQRVAYAAVDDKWTRQTFETIPRGDRVLNVSESTVSCH